MAMNYTPIPFDFLEEMEELSDAEYGRLVRWGQHYHLTGEKSKLSGNERFYSKRMQMQIDRYVEHYNEVRETRRNARKQKPSNDDSTSEQMISNDNICGETKTKTNTNTKTNIYSPNGEIDNAHEAVAYFLDRINPAPSSVLTRELLDFCESLGDEVVLHALHIAVDERKTAWSYIKAILNRYKADGLTDITAVQAAEQAHNARKGRGEGSYTPRKEKRPYGGGKRTQEEEERLAEENRIAMQNIDRLWSKMKADA